MLRPSNEGELAEAVASASGPLSVRGGGTRGMAGDGDALSVAGLSGITLYEPGALTLVARSGTPVTEIEAALAAENQMLAFEPMDHRPLLGTKGEPTIGGVVAANVSGPRRVQAGAARDVLLGVRFVDGRGTVVKNGGRVMKNVTGYDLARLMCGARGTLGVLTEVSLKVLPRPETQATVVLGGLEIADAASAMAAALASPFSVSGAAWTGGDVFLRIEGMAASVAYREGRVAGLFPKVEARILRGEKSAALWRGIRDAEALAGAPGDVWRISAKASEAPRLVKGLPGGAKVLVDWGGGLIWALVSEGTDLRRTLGAFDGHATLVRGEGHGPRMHPEAAPLAALAKRLRAEFDPRGILNPGVMG
ncbi:glycolate oxidase FAD binding subunit [Silicimonas algicola]|uniref:Glycolate oxidase FAD binding subunit n=1 Tax=Silicimonas algicola TaxID=1826607 RepID=A0A316G6L5_9RHOB|nr:glycolate oxidase FAD binding subunit [Silicimonas algicola]